MQTESFGTKLLLLLATPGFCISRYLILMYVGISQSSSADSECICISPVVAVVELCSLDKKEMHSLVLISVLQIICAHVLNKKLKNKDSQRSKQPKDLDSQFFLLWLWPRYQDTQRYQESHPFHSNSEKIWRRHLNVCCRCKAENESLRKPARIRLVIL